MSQTSARTRREIVVSAWVTRRGKHAYQSQQSHKICCNCHQVKQIENYRVRESHHLRADGTRALVISSWCNDCHSEYFKKWRSNGGQKKINANVRKFSRNPANKAKRDKWRGAWKANNQERYRELNRIHSTRVAIIELDMRYRSGSMQKKWMRYIKKKQG